MAVMESHRMGRFCGRFRKLRDTVEGRYQATLFIDRLYKLGLTGGIIVSHISDVEHHWHRVRAVP